ncbi:MAG: hypothetical protein INH41_03060 [Myxococcaceae bacterium]|jgi:predicted LPLAT superfamily acyltransferase|nr:hypothetical protein [Myxococcaceae bacterium]
MEATVPAWKQQPERGNAFVLRLLVRLDRALGRRLVGWILWWVAFYYAAVVPSARQASGDFLARAGCRAGFFDTVRHFRTFARVALDRARFATGRLEGLVITREGHEHIASARGALVVGAHLGSFEALQTLSHQHGLRLNVVVDLRNARQLSAVMAELAPEARVRFVSVDEHEPTSVLQLTEAIADGELVALLADRLTAASDRSIAVPFFGAMARFPTGPFVMAHALGCPVLFACALYREPNQYHLVCEPFSERLVLPRATRAEALEGACARFAATLERFARIAPDNWFNFFPFWEPHHDDVTRR